MFCPAASTLYSKWEHAITTESITVTGIFADSNSPGSLSNRRNYTQFGLVY